MKIDEIETRIAALKSLVGQKDSEPHRLEDELLMDVLKAIANGAPNPRKLAAAAIKSADVNIERWFE